MISITCPKFRLPAVHWFIASTTSAKVTTLQGGSFPFITQGPARVVVDDVVDVVEEEVVDVVVVEAFWIVVVVEKEVLVEVVVDDLRVVDEVVVVTEV
jgi:hypothetical protein